MPSLLYDLVLGAAAGFSVGFFAWMAADRLGAEGTPVFWPFAAIGMVAGVVVVRWARARGGRWVHALWLPVILFVLLMAAVVMALRNLD